MFMPIDVIAEQLEVDKVTIWRWAKAAGLRTETRKRGSGTGRGKIPFCALINYLIEKKKPFKFVEKGAYPATKKDEKTSPTEPISLQNS